jgi:DNA mismatch endonuclease (patch repair protein)
MADIFTKEKRSDVMSRIKGKNTGPELLVFRFLHKRGIYFQKHYKRVKGSPDIALPRKKRAVFIDGNFWHGHNFEACKIRLLEASQYYWVEKIERNMARDEMCRTELESNGWRVLRVWEYQLTKKSIQSDTLEEIATFLMD